MFQTQINKSKYFKTNNIERQKSYFFLFVRIEDDIGRFIIFIYLIQLTKLNSSCFCTYVFAKGSGLLWWRVFYLLFLIEVLGCMSIVVKVQVRIQLRAINDIKWVYENESVFLFDDSHFFKLTWSDLNSISLLHFDYQLCNISLNHTLILLIKWLSLSEFSGDNHDRMIFVVHTC